ncbi:hypothetical protein FS837_000546 [Tulasnella sp. UAMH 9824]|nr:hypothetical protein FS837_000546 [Tulasnella sp. UAMH 9824]
METFPSLLVEQPRRASQRSFHPLTRAYEIWPAGYNYAKENFYLGYTVEPSCMNTPYVPRGERLPQAYIFGSYLGYFMLRDYILWDENSGMEGSMTDDFYLDFSQKENVTFLAGQFSLFEAPGNYTDPPRGIVQHKRLPRPEFQKMIAHSRGDDWTGKPAVKSNTIR